MFMNKLNQNKQTHQQFIIWRTKVRFFIQRVKGKKKQKQEHNNKGCNNINWKEPWFSKGVLGAV
jgi:hypothetical protein